MNVRTCVVVPGWRVVDIPRRYVMEGTEVSCIFFSLLTLSCSMNWVRYYHLIMYH